MDERKRRAKGLATESRLIATTLALAARDGLANVDIEEVARLAQCSKSTAFFHLRDRRSWKSTIVSALERAYESEVVEPTREIFDPLRRLEDVCRRWWKAAWGSGLAAFQLTVLQTLHRMPVDWMEHTESQLAKTWIESLHRDVRALLAQRGTTDVAVERRMVSQLSALLLSIVWHRRALHVAAPIELAETIDTLIGTSLVAALQAPAVVSASH